MKKLIISADDFGATEGINNAIISLHKIGVVNFAALMVMGNASNDAITKAKRNSNLNIGLHFVLTDELGLTHGKSLINKNGHFYKRNSLLFRCIFNKINKKEINDELHAQYDYMKARGIKPSFINGHQHIHILPIISDVVSSFAKTKKLFVSIPSYYLPSRVYRVKNISSAFLSRKFKYSLDRLGVNYNKNFITNFSNDNRDFSLRGFEKCFHSAPYRGSSDYVYMVHPAKASNDLNKYWNNSDSLVADRIQEFTSLSNPDFIDICNKYRFKIV